MTKLCSGNLLDRRRKANY